jgi:MerR family transcriptional regulator, light-induced transcriptional regulator
MAEVGLKIEEGKLDIAQENSLSELLRYHLQTIYHELAPLEGSAHAERVLGFAAPEGNYHDFGLLTAAIFCRSAGLTTHFLGTNLPASSLAKAASELKLTAAVLSLTPLPPEEERISAKDYLRSLDEALPDAIAIWMGGRGASDFAQLRSKRREIWVFESLSALALKNKF